MFPKATKRPPGLVLSCVLKVKTRTHEITINCAITLAWCLGSWKTTSKVKLYFHKQFKPCCAEDHRCANWPFTVDFWWGTPNFWTQTSWSWNGSFKQKVIWKQLWPAISDSIKFSEIPWKERLSQPTIWWIQFFTFFNAKALSFKISSLSWYSIGDKL